MKLQLFLGAPSSFPTNSKAVRLQRYVEFSKSVKSAAADRRERLGFISKPYLAVHIRHGTDWVFESFFEILFDEPFFQRLEHAS